MNYDGFVRFVFTGCQHKNKKYTITRTHLSQLVNFLSQIGFLALQPAPALRNFCRSAKPETSTNTPSNEQQRQQQTKLPAITKQN